MKDLVEYIAKALVDEPNAVTVAEEESGDSTVVKLEVAKGDLGKVIGKKGRTAKAVRTLLGAAALKAGRRAQLEIIEPPVGA
ncbi:MAG: KH domain-containing protein [Deltaproteobacteria bacterium]|nr:KH domain-containing protein [Deltaproteobacteria bacterium]